MHQPKISVCIPTYNYGRFISEAIDSVLGQTFSDFELLVADNASTDSTEEIVRQFAAQDARIRYVRHESNLGMVGNWNYCLREARGKYIKFLFADDLFASDEILELMASVLDADESVSLVGSARKLVNSDSGITKILSFSRENKVLNGTVAINMCIRQKQNLIGEPTAVMFRNNQAERGFDNKYHQLVDLEMWFHLLEKGKYHYFAEPLCVFRMHDEQESAKNAKKCVEFDDILVLYSEYLCKPYIEFSRFFKKYLWHDYYYQIWKAFRKHHRIPFVDFAGRVRDYGLMRFFVLYPVFRMYKVATKISRKLGRKKS